MNNEERCKEVIASGSFFKIKVMPDQDSKEVARELGNDFDLVIISPSKCGTKVDEECGTAEIMAFKKAKNSAVGLDAEFEGITRILSSIRPDNAPIRGRLQEMIEAEVHERRCSVEE